MTDENEQELQRLQALADHGASAMLVVKDQDVKKPISPDVAAILLSCITEQDKIMGISTIPVKAVAKAQLDMEAWKRAVTSRLIDEATLDGEPVFILMKDHYVDGVGIVEHTFIDKLRYISQQDPTQWQSRMEQSLEQTRKARKNLN